MKVWAWVVGALAVTTVMAETSRVEQDAKTVKATRFELVDKEGNLRAVLGTGKDGLPVLAFTDSRGKVRLSIAVNKDGSPAIGMTNKDEKTTVAIAQTEKGSAFTLMDDEERIRASMSVESNGSPELATYDENGRKTKK